ncbi:MAG: hypothetical protein OES28_05980, partial [Desulfobulbaceae bacterium]|nr:hypothetical protein [Desulfobulbaceae bacterium]
YPWFHKCLSIRKTHKINCTSFSSGWGLGYLPDIYNFALFFFWMQPVAHRQIYITCRSVGGNPS